MAMKFAINTNGKEKFYMSTDSNLRKGFMEAVDTTGKVRVVVSEADFEEKVNSYVDTFVKHGVRSFIFAFEEKAKVYYYRMTPGEVKKHKKSLTRRIEYGIIYLMAVYIRQRKIMTEKKLKKICGKY